MSFFGGGMDKASKRYNSQVLDYNRWQLNRMKDIANQVQQYVNIGPESDVAYDTISGQYLNSNPYIDQVAGNVSQQIIDQYNKSTIPSALSSYAGSGRFGSGLFQKTLSDTQSQMNQDVANAMNNLYYNNYNTERGYQETARQRAASQYDMLNRYGQYANLVGGYIQTPALTKDSGSSFGNLLQSSMGVIGTVAGAMIGGPAGAAVGGAIGQGISSSLGS